MTGEPGPVTEAGRRYLAVHTDTQSVGYGLRRDAILAIEAEASRSVLGAVREGVEPLVVDDFAPNASFEMRRGWEAAIGRVLALLDTLTETEPRETAVPEWFPDEPEELRFLTSDEGRQVIEWARERAGRARGETP